MSFSLLPNGTIASWTVTSSNILFPEQTVLRSGAQKKRGGAPVCSPVFGPVLHTVDYEGITLPQHGLVRLGDQHFESTHQKDKQSEAYHFTYETKTFPWKHTVSIEVGESTDTKMLQHTLTIQRADDCTNPKPMPLSAAIHPYFATKGQPFIIKIARQQFFSESIPVDSPMTLIASPAQDIDIIFPDSTVRLSLAGSAYQHYAIWTDSIEDYICIEPIISGLDKPYALLKPGEHRTGVCQMTVSVSAR